MAKPKGGKAPAAKPKGTEEEQKPLLRFSFADSPQSFEIDPFDLTAEEEIMVEEFFDKPIGVLYREGWITASRKAQVYFAYLARRRKEPGFTYADAVGFDAEVTRDDTGGEEAAGAERPIESSSSGGDRS